MPFENYLNHENQKITTENQENHETHKNQAQNNEKHTYFIITYKNLKNPEHSITPLEKHENHVFF